MYPRPTVKKDARQPARAGRLTVNRHAPSIVANDSDTGEHLANGLAAGGSECHQVATVEQQQKRAQRCSDRGQRSSRPR